MCKTLDKEFLYGKNPCCASFRYVSYLFYVGWMFRIPESNKVASEDPFVLLFDFVIVNDCFGMWKLVFWYIINMSCELKKFFVWHNFLFLYYQHTELDMACVSLRDFRLPLWCCRGLSSSGKLNAACVGSYLLTFWDRLSVLSERIQQSNSWLINMHCLKSQKSEGLMRKLVLKLYIWQLGLL